MEGESIADSQVISIAQTQKENEEAMNNFANIGCESPNSLSTIAKCKYLKEKEGRKDKEAGKLYTEVFSWGSDKHGQLGLGERYAQGSQLYSVPKLCSYNIAISQLACGQAHTVFITRKFALTIFILFVFQPTVLCMLWAPTREANLESMTRKSR